MEDDEIRRLYAAYGPALYARCLRLLQNKAAAEDAMQETFLKVHRQLTKAPDDARSFAWMYRVATNLCLTMIRDQKPARAVSVLPDPPSEPDGEQRLIDRDLAERLLRRAAPKLQLPAWLRHVEGLELEEIAKVVGVTSRTIASRLAAFELYARRLLDREAK